MIVLLDTSTSECRLAVVKDDAVTWHRWQADRELAKGLLSYLIETLKMYNAEIADVSGIGVFKGPGSFTGLRIGLTVMNTVADGRKIPIVGGSGERWVEDVRAALERGENEEIVLPDYGAEAHITKPRK